MRSMLVAVGAGTVVGLGATILGWIPLAVLFAWISGTESEQLALFVAPLIGIVVGHATYRKLKRS